MDSLPAKFHYGRCPCCDKIIPIPSGVNKIHCCYCGEAFLSKAAVALYGYQETVTITEDKPVPAKEPEKPKLLEPPPIDTSIPRMMSIRGIANETGLSEFAVRKMVREGKIPTVQVGVKRLINYSKVCDLINQGLLGYTTSTPLRIYHGYVNIFSHI